MTYRFITNGDSCQVTADELASGWAIMELVKQKSINIYWDIYQLNQEILLYSLLSTSTRCFHHQHFNLLGLTLFQLPTPLILLLPSKLLLKLLQTEILVQLELKLLQSISFLYIILPANQLVYYTYSLLEVPNKLTLFRESVRGRISFDKTE